MKARVLIVCSLLLLVAAPLAYAATAPGAPAAPAAAAAAAASEDQGAFAAIGGYLSDGGPMMIVILLVSIVGTALFAERAYTLYVRNRLNADAFLSGVFRFVERREYSRALAACNVRSEHPLVDVIKAAVVRANRREKEIESAMETEMLAAMPRLQKRVGLMGLLANTATLLGLLGTIFGLIMAFNSVALASAAERQQALAGGISQAMYTTAFGISVAVPLLFFHHFLSKRVDRITMEAESGLGAMLVSLFGERNGNPQPAAERDGRDWA